MTWNRQRLLIKVSVAAGLLLAGVVRASDQTTSSITLDGTVVVQTVDERRVLVAVDTLSEGRPVDGVVDHIFLFTASKPIHVPSVVQSGEAHVEFFGNTLAVILDNGRQILEFVVINANAPPPVSRPGALRLDQAIGLSHYTGWGGFLLTDLQTIKHSTDCDACYDASGHRLRFPA